MGTGREKRHPHKDGHHATPAASSTAGGVKKLLILFQDIPKAGMIYPFQHALLKRDRRDRALTFAILKSVRGKFNRYILDTRLALIFETAIDLVREDIVFTQYPITIDPIDFFRLLRNRAIVRRWAMGITENLFISLFLVLRAARQKWHDNPRHPLEIDKHCRIARAIDVFNRVDPMKWNGVAVVEWIRKGGLMFQSASATPNAPQTIGDDTAAKDADMPDLSDLAHPAAPDDSTATNNDSNKDDPDDPVPANRHLTPEQVIASMRLLNIDVDQTALTEVFGRLNIAE
ncbi:hypothetical protein C8A05DRAFT_18731 [Staphylotrichum tortipilum]|uniref:Uncharacterized protein n=1 Tax=Staphylotrichum tortipilum TaxID=2831512 RepID=A0AAN6RQR8_9PEZI|nr:hypothetical protein C8A05DRAFT_18731 [Staphylotrichum longicolle]